MCTEQTKTMERYKHEAMGGRVNCGELCDNGPNYPKYHRSLLRVLLIITL